MNVRGVKCEMDASHILNVLYSCANFNLIR